MEFHDKLRSARNETGLTQQQVADKMGITKSTYCGYETGKRKPDVKKIKELARILNVTGSYLIGVDEQERSSKKAPLYSSEAMRMARDYDALDHWGKTAVRELADTELARMEDEKQFLLDTTLEPEPKVINLFDNPSAAGPALGMTGQGCQPYELGPEDPPGASYAIRVQGDSMEPYFPDGSIAFVNHDQMRDGDIGIFCVDGATVIKQWHRDPAGTTYLFSLNRKRVDADLVLVAGSERSLVWQGRVITKRRFPVPGQ